MPSLGRSRMARRASWRKRVPMRAWNMVLRGYAGNARANVRQVKGSDRDAQSREPGPSRGGLEEAAVALVHDDRARMPPVEDVVHAHEGTQRGTAHAQLGAHP